MVLPGCWEARVLKHFLTQLCNNAVRMSPNLPMLYSMFSLAGTGGEGDPLWGEGWPMRGLELIMWSEGQWEALKKLQWKGTYIYIYIYIYNQTSQLLDRSGPRADSVKIYIYIYFTLAKLQPPTTRSSSIQWTLYILAGRIDRVLRKVNSGNISDSLSSLLSQSRAGGQAGWTTTCPKGSDKFSSFN